MRLPQLEDLDPLERMALINISYSRLNTYETCPSKYFYTYIQKEDRVFGEAATLGNIIHSVLEDHVGEDLDVDEMIESMAQHREGYDPDKLINDKLISDGIVMLQEFVDRHSDEKFEIVGKELPFQVIIGSAYVRGFIDLVALDPNGRVAIIDWKSGKNEVSYKDAPTNMQLGIYALAVSQMYPDQEIYAELYYLRSGRRKGHLFKPQDLEEVYYKVVDSVNEVINDQNFSATKNYWPCTFCDYVEICPTGTRRMKYR